MEAIELFKKLVVETRKEEGCLKYDLIEDNENKGFFFLIELWETAEHHHQRNGAFDEFPKSVEKFVGRIGSGL